MLAVWLLAVGMSLGAMGCGGDGGTRVPPPPPPPVGPGTPPGTYSITVSGAGGSLEHFTTVTLVVQ